MNFEQLRKKHPKFIYEGFDIIKNGKNLKITFDFLLEPNIKFNPVVIFPNISKKPEGLENLVFNLGLVEMISYWKITCSPEIIVKAGKLTEQQIAFWKDLIKKGLGEFFYKNNLDFIIPDIISNGHSGGGRSEKKSKKRNLILVGGGKDSAVTLEQIKKSGKEFNCLLLNPTEAAIKVSKFGGCKNPIIIKRIIDPKLLELNKQGYLNGHTPFSAYLAFLSTLAANLYDYKNIVVSNEISSNEGNMEYHGQIINHQYSKSFEFEEKFREYSKKYLSSDSYYYSFLREFNELEIARQFAVLTKYHKIFRSCNRGFKQGIWCNQCSKCLFTYLMLYPFLDPQNLFGKDLLSEESLAPIMKELLQLPGKFKPFECVGTKEEVEYAMLLGILKNKKLLLEKCKGKISILVLGMGREGQVTKEFLQKNDIEFATADQKDDKNYLEKINQCDIIIKSPGIPYYPEIKRAKDQGKIITSATQIFFDLFKGKIIGVTGTKGKSQTAALIYEVLKEGGLDVALVGNIGKPALEQLDKDLIVYELSSFQLADLQKSPHIAVITNIYPDHLDYHGSFENYKKAKENITKYQTGKDILIRMSGVDAAKAVAKIFKIPQNIVSLAIKNFKPLPHRLEFVGQVKGIKFYNDSLSTNPHATIYGLKILGDDVETLIAGGFDRGVDYSILGPVIASSKIQNLILFPDTGEKIWKSVKGKAERVKKFEANNMGEAVKIAFENTSPGKICLMSPSSASFNMFKDYEDRGNQFKKFVKLLGSN